MGSHCVAWETLLERSRQSAMAVLFLLNKGVVMSNIKVKANDHESYGSFTLISFIIPIVGIVVGVMYLAKDKPLDKKLGEHLIAISILFMIIQGFLLMLFWGSLFPASYTTVPVRY